MKQGQQFAVVNVNTNQLPIITEDTKTRYQYVPFGVYGQDDFFEAVITAWNVSTTTSACVEGIADLIYGKGLYSKNEAFNDTLSKLIPQEETKRVAFDLKLFGNASYQVYWNDEHTKVIKFYHVPVQYLRAEKLYGNPKIENYYYCHDWQDQRAVKNKKKIPAFGTSNEKMEILYVKNYFPGLYYYSLPDWVSAMQYSVAEGEISNLHINNITNGFLPAVMINFNNGVPDEEKMSLQAADVKRKLTGASGAKIVVSFNSDETKKTTIDNVPLNDAPAHYQYLSEEARGKILLGHNVTSGLLFGIPSAFDFFFSIFFFSKLFI
jgi:hypothetical protein